MDIDQDEAAAVKAFAIKMSRDPSEGFTARQRALMACIVLPQPIQQWMLDAGAVEPLLDSIEKTILAAESSTREQCAKVAENYRSNNPYPTVYAAIATAIRSQ